MMLFGIFLELVRICAFFLPDLESHRNDSTFIRDEIEKLLYETCLTTGREDAGGNEIAVIVKGGALETIRSRCKSAIKGTAPFS